MPSTHRALGLTAVILCGEGNDLKPLLSNVPKALLPVANKPMIQYPLEWLLDGGIDAIIIVCLQGQEDAIRAVVKDIYVEYDSYYPKGTKPTPLPEVIGAVAPGSGAGTAEALRQPQVYGAIKTDFMVVACDSICEIRVATLIKEWMLLPENAGNKAGALSVWYDIKKEKGTERDLALTTPVPRFGVTSTTKAAELSYLLEHFGSRRNDLDHDLDIRTAVFKRHPKVALQTAQRDAHIYVLPHWSLKFILANYHDKMASLKDHVLPWWAKAGWQASGVLAQELGLIGILQGHEDASGDQNSGTESVLGGLAAEDIENFLGMSTMRVSTWQAPTVAAKGRKEINTRGWFPTATGGCDPSPVSSPSDSDKPKRFQKIKEPEYNGLFVPGVAIFKPKMTITPLTTTPLVRRVDSLPLYLSTCLEIARNPITNCRPVAMSAKIHLRSNVSSIDSMVGEHTDVDERVIVKRTVIGNNVRICKLARIQSCVILDGVTVGAGCKLDGCIIGRSVKIGPGSSLTGCQVTEGVTIRDGSVEKDRLIDQDSEDSSDDDMFGASDGDQDDGDEGEEGEEEDDEDEDDEDEDDDKNDDDDKSSKSVPTVTKESAAPISSILSSTHTSKPAAQPEPEEPAKEAGKGVEETAQLSNDTNTSPQEKDGQQTEEASEGGPSVPFLQLELADEDSEEEEDDFEPDSDESSFCDEEYDSQFDSDAVASGDDAGNLSGPEEDGGPLKSPKRISKSFSEDLTKIMAQVVGLDLKSSPEETSKVGGENNHIKEEDTSKPVKVEDPTMEAEPPVSIGTSKAAVPPGTAEAARGTDNIEVTDGTKEVSQPAPTGLTDTTNTTGIPPVVPVADPVSEKREGK